MGAATGAVYDSRWYFSPLDDEAVFAASGDFSVAREAYRMLKPLIVRIRGDIDQLADFLDEAGEANTPVPSEDEPEEEVEEPQAPFNPPSRKCFSRPGRRPRRSGTI
jgi:hypothetical protein